MMTKRKTNQFRFPRRNKITNSTTLNRTFLQVVDYKDSRRYLSQWRFTHTFTTTTEVLDTTSNQNHTQARCLRCIRYQGGPYTVKEMSPWPKSKVTISPKSEESMDIFIQLHRSTSCPFGIS